MSKKIKKLPEYLEIKLGDDTKIVKAKLYVAAKVKDLTEFGYGGLDEKQLSESVIRVVNGEAKGIIDMFVQNDIVLP